MSSYLNLYYVLKEGDNKPLNFLSVCRSSPLYGCFHDNLSVPWCSGEVEKFADLKKSDIEMVKNDLKESIERTKKRLVEYERYAGSNPDYIEEIISSKEYIEELEGALNDVLFIGELIDDISFNCCNCFEKIVMNEG